MFEYDQEVERERREAAQAEEDLKTQLHNARRDFMERIQQAAPEGWEIIVREKKDKAKDITAPDKIVDTVRGIDRKEQ
jgi:F0F1-type ATP synthase membrane subunit b/b'